MKTKPSLLLLAASAILLAGCNYANRPPVTTPVTPPITATPTPAPTREQTLNDLNTELNATVDDGGAADLNQLKKDASGL
ncbi:hypothetical protein HYS10_00055 [Candidatus Collierbacteria bacterium]|nr:hypothetical protein [Candidatus Collierbacteria bacterium]